MVGPVAHEVVAGDLLSRTTHDALASEHSRWISAANILLKVGHVSPPFLCSGGSATGLSATDARWVVAGDNEPYAEPGDSAMVAAGFAIWRVVRFPLAAQHHRARPPPPATGDDYYLDGRNVLSP
jgi:hypothetical protein